MRLWHPNTRPREKRQTHQQTWETYTMACARAHATQEAGNRIYNSW